MGILEIVFNSRKFDLNDDVLMGFDNYFDKKSRPYDNIILGLISYKIPIYWEVAENEKSKVMEVLYERERKNYPIMV